MMDSLGCFVAHGGGPMAGAPLGPLAGTRFAVKDIFDIAGRPTGCGNPDWLRTHPIASATAPTVLQCLAAGATMVGKTITEELAYSLQGENFHYGTPLNSAAPDRIPGGSSSGSASAVAGLACDFALGSDTGGSVRIPAAFCGLFGIRPSHGRVLLEGVMPLAPSMDTVGWFARNATLLETLGRILLPERRPARPFARLLVAEDAFAFADPEIAAACRPAIEALRALLGASQAVTIAPGTEGLTGLMQAMRFLQGREIWSVHGAWVESERPQFGPEIAQRFAWAKEIAAAAPGDQQTRRDQQTRYLQETLGADGVVILPTTPTVPPLKAQPLATMAEFRLRTLSLTVPAVMARLPQVTLPVARPAQGPVGLSLMAAHGQDESLLALARQLADKLALNRN